MPFEAILPQYVPSSALDRESDCAELEYDNVEVACFKKTRPSHFNLHILYVVLTLGVWLAGPQYHQPIVSKVNYLLAEYGQPR